MKNFDEIYQQIYTESGNELQELKKENMRKNSFLILILIALGIITIMYFNFFTLFIFIIVLIVLAVKMSKQYGAYKKVYKEKVISRFVKEYSEQLDYIPQRGISSREYQQAGFDGYYDRYHSEDLIQGTILDGCTIKLAEVHTEREEETTDSDGNTTTTYVTLFHGLFAQIDLKKLSKLNFRVVKNALLFKGKDRMEMDSGEFEKIYDVKTEDQISTLRVLTSEVMQMLIDFKQNNKVAPEVVVDNNFLYIRFGVGNVFEPNIIKNDMDYDNLKKNYDMINFVFNLTEEFSKHIIEFEE